MWEYFLKKWRSISPVLEITSRIIYLVKVGKGDGPPPDPVLHDFLWKEHPVTQNQITLNDQIDQISPPLIVRRVLAQG